MSITAYLRRTSNRGNYSYRRAVSPDLRVLWGKLEEKVSLKTKSHAEALRRAAVVNTQFDEKAVQLRQQLSGRKLPNRQVMEVAREILVKEGIHPQQIPKTKEEALRFFKDQDEWKDRWLDILPGVEQTHASDGRGGYEIEYKADEHDPWYQAYNVITGEGGLSMVPTLEEATRSYLEINAEEKKRTPSHQKRHEGNTYRAVNALGPLDTPITEFNRLKARQHKAALVVANPTWADDTLFRTMKILSAIFNSAIKEYELGVANPWSGLTGTVKKNRDDLTSEDRGNKRRSMNPDEIISYKGHLLKANLQASLVGQLMIQIGCGLVPLTFRSPNSFMRPFVRIPRGFFHLTTSAAVLDCKTH